MNDEIQRNIDGMGSNANMDLSPREKIIADNAFRAGLASGAGRHTIFQGGQANALWERYVRLQGEAHYKTGEAWKHALVALVQQERHAECEMCADIGRDTLLREAASGMIDSNTRAMLTAIADEVLENILRRQGDADSIARAAVEDPDAR